MNNYYDEIKQIFENHNGIARRADISSYHYYYLNELLKDGKIIRLKRGIYQWIDGVEIDDLEILFELIPEAILCVESALYYHGYSDRTPDCWNIAVSRGINKGKLNISYPLIKAYFVDQNLLTIGLIEGNINGIKARVYNKERTTCDILKYSNKLDKELVNNAIQSYIKDSNKNVSQLISYGKTLKVSKKIQTWLGVWF